MANKTLKYYYDITIEKIEPPSYLIWVRDFSFGNLRITLN